LAGHHWRRLAHRERLASVNESYIVEHRRIGSRTTSILGRRRLLLVADEGLIALHVPTDAHHAEAIACRDKTLRFSRLYSSSAVIAETVAHIQRDHLLDQQHLQDLINDFLQSQRWISLLAVEDNILMEALQMVKDRNDRRFGLVDATNILLMEKHHIDVIFSFDTLFDGVTVRRGYNTRFLQRVGPPLAP
jgi:predicted nucleic acid-binding protein